MATVGVDWTNVKHLLCKIVLVDGQKFKLYPLNDVPL